MNWSKSIKTVFCAAFILAVLISGNALAMTFPTTGYTVIATDPVDPAIDPDRDLVMMGIIGKTLFVVVTWYHALIGSGPLNFAFLVLADLVFALFFLRFWLKTRGQLRSG